MTEKEQQLTEAIASKSPVASRLNTSLQLSRHSNFITDDAAWELANRIKNSSIIPKDFVGKPENIFIAILMGREVGLAAMQSIQNIMVINGRPCMWGDALPALVYASGKVEKFEEEIDEGGKWARCTVRRNGDQKDHVQLFTWADAVKAGYDKKSGPWQTNPKRMLQMRARAFALRDKFADILKGLGMVEEAMDYDLDVTEDSKKIDMPKEITDVAIKADAYAKQQGAPSQVDLSSEAKKPSDDADHPQLLKAKEQFKQDYNVAAETIDAYLAANNLQTYAEKYPRLITLWKDLRSKKTTVEKEFGAFMTPSTEEGADETFFTE